MMKNAIISVLCVAVVALACFLFSSNDIAQDAIGSISELAEQAAEPGQRKAALAIPEIETTSRQLDPTLAEEKQAALSNDKLIEELRDTIAKEFIAELPPGWATPIQEPSSGEGPSVGGVPHGDWVVQHPVTGWVDRGKFVLGSREGEWKLYDSKNQLIRVRSFVHGKVNGTVTSRDSATGDWQIYECRDGVRVD